MKSILKLLVSAALLYILLYKTSYKDIINNALLFSYSALINVIILYVTSLLVAVYKWHLLIPFHKFRKLLSITLVSQFYSTFMPGQIAGEIVKIYRLGKGRNDPEYIAASVIIDKLTGILGLLAVAFSGLLMSNYHFPLGIIFNIFLFAIVILITLFFLKIPLLHRAITNTLRKIGALWPQYDRFLSLLTRLFDVWEQFLADSFKLILVFSLSAIFQITCILINIFLAQDLGIKIPFSEWCWIFGLISIAVMLPISIGGIGVREGAFAGILSLQGIPVEKSITLSLAVFGVSLIGAFIGGGVELFRVITSSYGSFK